MLLLAHVLVMFLAVQAFQTLQDWRSFIWFAMVFGFLVCVFGILQHLTFNGKLYWFREMHYGGIPFGPYVNRNHFAGFAELFRFRIGYRHIKIDMPRTINHYSTEFSRSNPLPDSTLNR